LRLEFGFRLVKRDESLGLGIEQRRCRHVATAGDTAGPAVAARLQPLMKLRAERVDDDRALLGRGRERLVLVDEKSRFRFGCKCGRLVSLRRSGFERAAFKLPFVETAVEYRDILEAERCQHPPEPRRPHRGADAVEHDLAFVGYAVAAERALEESHIRHHEAERGAGIRELALQVQKTRARNMPGL